MRSWRELPIVIGCAGVLILLMTASVDVEKSRMARCQNNLREIYRMAECYSADNDGYTIQALQMRYNRGIFWSDRAMPYAKEFLNFSCPSNEKRGAAAYELDELLPGRYSIAYVSYGINVLISGRLTKVPDKISNLHDPAYTVYFGDAKYLRLRPTVERLWKGDYMPAHNNGMQAVMADGHVQYFNQENLGTFGKIPGWKRDVARWRKWKKNATKSSDNPKKINRKVQSK